MRLCAKRMFYNLREAMTASDDNEERAQAIDFVKLQKLTQETKFQLKFDDLQIQHEAETTEKNRLHKVELKQARLEAENETMRRILAGSHALPIPTHIPPRTKERPSST
jgi:hypothetical protein